MAQRGIKGLRFHQPLPPHADDQRALERVRYALSEWEQLNWYVEFAEKKLDALSTGEFLTVKEEVRALERTLVRSRVGTESLPEPTDNEVRQYHTFFRERVAALADMGMISFELPSRIVSIRWDGWNEHHTGQRWLELHFVELLKKFSPAIQRCPYEACGKLFLKPRANAYYCSRQCQNRAAMKKVRQRAKQQRAVRVPRTRGKRMLP